MEYKRKQEITTMLADAIYEKVMQAGIIDEISEINPRDLVDTTFRYFYPKMLNSAMLYAHNSGKYDENELKVMETMNNLVQMLDNLDNLGIDNDDDNNI